MARPFQRIAIAGAVLLAIGVLARFSPRIVSAILGGAVVFVSVFVLLGIAGVFVWYIGWIVVPGTKRAIRLHELRTWRAARQRHGDR